MPALEIIDSVTGGIILRRGEHSIHLSAHEVELVGGELLRITPRPPGVRLPRSASEPPLGPGPDADPEHWRAGLRGLIACAPDEERDAMRIALLTLTDAAGLDDAIESLTATEIRAWIVAWDVQRRLMR